MVNAMTTTNLLRPWVGYKNGVEVASYPDRWAADAALLRRDVEMTTPAPIPVATGRDPEHPCQRGTVGCCIDHSDGYESCETW